MMKFFRKSQPLISFKVNFPVLPSRIQFCLKKLHQANAKNPIALALTLNGISDSPQQGHTLYQAFYNSASRLRIPVYTFLQDKATSMTYLAANCGTIIANPFCLIGDIGTTFKSYHNIKKLLDYIGTKQQPIWNQFTTPDKNQKQFSQKWIDTVQNNLMNVISIRRNIPLTTIKTIKNKLYHPLDALKIGLIDQIGLFQQFKQKNFPNNPLKQIIISNDGYNPKLFNSTQIDILTQLFQLIKLSPLKLLSQNNINNQPIIYKFIQLINNKLQSPQIIKQIDFIIGQFLQNIQLEIINQSPLKLQ